MSKRVFGVLLVFACSLVLVTSTGTAKAASWEPKMPVEFVVPAGAGGGADVMARFISPIITKHKLSPRPFVVLNKSAGAGAEGFLYVKGQKGNPHVVIISLDNLFTTPLATGVPFNWKDMTPVAMMALDYFILWVHADTPYKTAADYFDAVRKAPNKFVMGGTGAKQEDQVLTVLIEQTYGLKFNYVPFGGGGAVAVELVGKHIDSTVNNPSEAVSHMKNGTLRALAVCDTERIDLPDWKQVPTLKESAGKDVAYMMLRGIFMPPGVKPEVLAFYVDVFKKVSETPEWQKYVSDMGLKAQFMEGDDYVKWLEGKEVKMKELMTAGGLLK